MFKQCIWCLKNENEVSFNNVAHTIPDALGGIHICKNVCDLCNSFFGNTQNNLPSIDESFKEVFIISRQRLLRSNVSENKSQLQRPKSRYFEIDFNKKQIKIKKTLKHNIVFQQNLLKSFKRGWYKVFLEEIERQFNNARNQEFDHIRQVAKNGIGDYKMFYFQRKRGIILLANHEDRYLEFLFNKMSYLYNSENYKEIEFLGHVLGFTISPFEDLLSYHLGESLKRKKDHFIGFKEVKKILDIDLMLNIFNK